MPNEIYGRKFSFDHYQNQNRTVECCPHVAILGLVSNFMLSTHSRVFLTYSYTSVLFVAMKNEILVKTKETLTSLLLDARSLLKELHILRVPD